jgi:hypothetical protein
MKRNSIIAVFLGPAFLCGALGAFAQHCMFDGASMIIVQLTDIDDKPLFGSAADLTLQEMDNPEADACRLTKGLLSLSFLPPANAFLQRYSRQGFDSFSSFCEDCEFNADGFYAVILGQGEPGCMIKKDDDTDYHHVKRKFEVRYKRDDVEQSIAVPPDKIFSMCTGTGKWSRFEPIKFQLKPVMVKNAI